MSVRLMALVWELDLPPGEKLVLLALADQANDEGRQCWPAVSTIARKSGQGERTVRRALHDLEAKGHLTRDHRDGTSTQYHVHPCQIGTPDKSAPLPKTPDTPAKLAPKTPVTIKAQKAKPSSRKRASNDNPGHRLPEDWSPAELGRDTVSGEILAHRGEAWGRRVLETFRNHWRTANGPNSLKRDWQSAWANWVIEQDRRDGRNGRIPNPQSPGIGRTAAAGLRVFGTG